jgi:hypothetical protein
MTSNLVENIFSPAAPPADPSEPQAKPKAEAKSEPKAEPPKMPTPRFKNPMMDRLFRRAKRRVEIVPVTIRATDEDTGVESEEVVEFMVQEMSAGMKARFESMMQESTEALVDEGEILDGEDDEEIGERVKKRMDMGNFKLSIVAASVTDMEGNAIVDMTEIEAAKELPAYIVEPLFEKSFILSGLGKPKKNEKAAENG